MAVQRDLYPRPDFVREAWASLDGNWEFLFDEADTVEQAGDFCEREFPLQIAVPFCYQAKQSGIGSDRECGVVWYRRKFAVDEHSGKRILLKFGAVDYKAKVWVNGIYIGSHCGGHTSFALDITHAVQKENQLVVRVEDYAGCDQPRGKQSWLGQPFDCWYTPTTGIWQSVWLEYAGEVYVERVKLTPDADRLQADCEVFLSSHQETTVQIHAHTQIEGMEYSFGTQEMICREGYGRAVLAFPDLDFRRDYFFWTPEHPNLIDVDVSVGKEDQVFVYFGMRKIIQHHGRFVLNDKEYFQRLVLDQGYWPDTLMTPPSRKALQEDIRLAKAMGFNGVRKHQKIEDPAFYYYADQLGLLVWGELPSCYAYNDRMVQRSIREMTEFLERDFNHPCIVAWVPVNESWGVRQVWANEKQQHYVQMMLHLLKAMDHTRLVNGNDGWEQVSQTDFCTVHDYTLMPHNTQKYADLERALDGIVEQRIVFASGHRYQGQAVVLSEYGGIAFRGEKDEEWGYYGKVDSEEAFFARLEPVTDYVIQSGQFAGFCYTQLTDVMQEANGLLTQDRRPKVELKRLKKIFSKSIRGEREANQR